MPNVLLRNFIPIPTIELGGYIIALLVLLGLIYEYREWRRIAPPGFLKTASLAFGTGRLLRTFLSEFRDRVILQRDVIIDSRLRLTAHLCVFWGFVATAIATTLLWVYGTPNEFLPSMIFGNAGGVLLVIGGTIILGRVAFVNAFRRERTIADLLFSALLYATAVTGFATEIAKFYGTPITAYPVYAIHLGVVALLLGSAPFTSFSHAILTPSMRYVTALQKMLSAEFSARAGYKIDYKQVEAARRLTEIVRKKSEKQSES